jgi:xanthine dehydrogenase molybdopterin-binding subunit B
MALAMTDKSAKFLYTTDSNGRGMIGAKKHIYECNKLLCEHGRKEYGLGVDLALLSVIASAILLIL